MPNHNFPGNDKRTPQQIAADVDKRSQLPEHKAYEGRQPLEILFAAIARDDVEKTEEYLRILKISAQPQKGWRDIDSRDEDFGFPHPLLHRAMLAKSYNVAEMLVNKGANIDARDHDDNTALHTMALAHNKEGAAYLLEWGATKEPENGEHKTPFDLLPEQKGNHDGESTRLWQNMFPPTLSLVREGGKEPVTPRSAAVRRR